jgi:biopolymer transport protein ExbB
VTPAPDTSSAPSAPVSPGLPPIEPPAASEIPADAPAGMSGATATPAPTVGHAALPRDLSPWGMFINADIVVKAIMIGLLFASLVTWTVWLAKSIELASAKRQARAGLLKLQEARSLPEAERKFGDADDTVARLVRTASTEVALSGHASGEGLKERVAWLLERLEVAAGRRIGRGMGVLASIGATAPFVGLLGTVWGIMNSFIGISNAHTTNLAVVAPGIAEALLATALGLFAAIPAVVIYNVFARSAAGYRMLIADAGALVLRLVSRDSERGAMALSRAAE